MDKEQAFENRMAAMRKTQEQRARLAAKAKEQEEQAKASTAKKADACNHDRTKGAFVVIIMKNSAQEN